MDKHLQTGATAFDSAVWNNFRMFALSMREQLTIWTYTLSVMADEFGFTEENYPPLSLLTDLGDAITGLVDRLEIMYSGGTPEEIPDKLSLLKTVCDLSSREVEETIDKAKNLFSSGLIKEAYGELVDSMLNLRNMLPRQPEPEE